MPQVTSLSRQDAPRGHPARPSRGIPRRRLLYFGGGLLALVLAVSALYRVAVPPVSAAEVKIGAPAPDVTFTTTDGVQRRLSQFRGHPVMFWLFATWCPTCEAGTAAVAQHVSQFEQAGVQIIQLKLYNNLGYPGPSVEEFARVFARLPRPSPGWLWGDASQEASYIYDPKGYPDLYFLIDRAGIIRAINGAPNVTMDEILSFARTGR